MLRIFLVSVTVLYYLSNFRCVWIRSLDAATIVWLLPRSLSLFELNHFPFLCVGKTFLFQKENKSWREDLSRYLLSFRKCQWELANMSPSLILLGLATFLVESQKKKIPMYIWNLIQNWTVFYLKWYYKMYQNNVFGGMDKEFT